ncbi:MAG: DUF308 domain-containing protein [Oscillospiraceae bacterium]|nr:DUF308 domain-containing protein [Oscillospiraceae bacterium]
MELNKLKGLRRNLVLLALVELIGGLFLIVYNDRGLEIVLRIIGIIAASYGLITLILWLFKKEKKENITMLITAVLGIAAGACFIFLWQSMQDVFTLIVGIFAGVYGVLKLPNMFAMKKAGFKKWFLLLIPILLIVGIGIVIGLNAFNNAVFTPSVSAILLGAAFILGCAADIIALAGASGIEETVAIATEVDAEAPAITENKES